MIEALKAAGQWRRGAGQARPVSHHDVPAGSRPDRLADLDLRRPDRLGDAGPVRDAVVVLCAARAGRGMAEILEQAAAARLERSDGADQAARAEGRRQSADLHGQPALLQGSAGQTARGGSCAHERAFEPIIGRYMHLDLFGRQHRIYVEEAGEGTPLLCLHTAGSRRPAIPRADERRARHAQATASSPSTCPGTANRRRRPAGTTRNTSSPRRNTPP